MSGTQFVHITCLEQVRAFNRISRHELELPKLVLGK